MERDEERRHDRRQAARVATGLLVPAVVLLLAGRPDLILYAAFGSFTGMYGRHEPRGERLRHQFHGAGMLVTGVAVGSLLAAAGAHPAVLIACVTVFATIGSLVTDHLRLRPGGPFFGIFALGACAMVGPGLLPWWGAVGICGATALLSIALGLLSGGPPSDDVRAPSPPWVTRATAVHAVRYAVATALAGAAGLLAGVDHANWAMASAAVPLAVVAGGEALALRAVVDRGLTRLAGTLLGLLVTSVLLLPMPEQAVLAAAVVVLLFPTELFMSRSYGLALGFFTPLILIMTDLASPSDPGRMIVARALDTAIGVAAAIVAAALIARPRRTAAEG